MFDWADKHYQNTKWTPEAAAEARARPSVSDILNIANLIRPCPTRSLSGTACQGTRPSHVNMALWPADYRPRVSDRLRKGWLTNLFTRAQGGNVPPFKQAILGA